MWEVIQITFQSVAYKEEFCTLCGPNKNQDACPNPESYGLWIDISQLPSTLQGLINCLSMWVEAI